MDPWGKDLPSNIWKIMDENNVFHIVLKQDLKMISQLSSDIVES